MRILLLFGSLGFVVVLTILSTAPVMAVPGVPQSNQIIFEVSMEGDYVGRDTYTFRRSNDQLHVQRRVTLSSSWGPINLFTYRHQSTGIWSDGLLQKLSATTRQNDEKTRVQVDRRDTQLVIKEGEETGPVDGGILPTSWWNPETRSAQRLIDTQYGPIRSVEVVHQGTERVQRAENQVVADRYDVQNDLELSLWYGPDQELVSIQFERKGYTFRYRRVK